MQLERKAVLQAPKTASRSRGRVAFRGLLALVVLCTSCLVQAQPGAYATGKYRDLFAEAGHPPAQTRARLDAAYAQLFHGKPQDEAIYFAAGANPQGPLAYISDIGNHDVRTEGMSYGMMIAVQLDRKADFDALWNWAMTYMYLGSPSQPAYGYFAWSCRVDGQHNDETPAPDGEEYFAMALYFASARWGDATGIYDYHSQADRLLRTMLHRKRIVATTKFGNQDVAAEMDEAHSMVRFIPGVSGRDFTDPSYQLPAFYELWARWGPAEDRPFWARAARASRIFFSKAANPVTGLTPVNANFDGTPHATGFPQSTEFGYDAWRTASNWSVDWSWWHADPQEPILSNRIQAFFAAQGPAYAELYTLEGKPVLAGHPAGLVAANAVAGLAATDQARARRFTEELWSLGIPRGPGRYYGGMLYLLSALHASGNFRIWTPAWAQGGKR